jgi:hypothetical protein
MHCWRVTKYDPVYRDLEGNFKKEDWTSYYDIGKVYGGQEFTLSDYLSIESSNSNAMYECFFIKNYKRRKIR